MSREGTAGGRVRISTPALAPARPTLPSSSGSGVRLDQLELRVEHPRAPGVDALGRSSSPSSSIGVELHELPTLESSGAGSSSGSSSGSSPAPGRAWEGRELQHPPARGSSEWGARPPARGPSSGSTAAAPAGGGSSANVCVDPSDHRGRRARRLHGRGRPALPGQLAATAGTTATRRRRAATSGYLGRRWSVVVRELLSA